MSLARKTLNGLKWSYLFTVINVVAQLGLTIVLARLLSPKDYGLVAMGNVVLRFGSYFAQMGIGQSLIQKNEVDKRSVFTAYTLTMLLSLFFYLVIFFLAPLSQYIFPNPQVTIIIRVLAINLVFSSVATVAISLLRVDYKYRVLGTIDFIAFIIGNGAVAICMAVWGFGVWSLVAAVLVQGAIQLLLAFYFTRQYYSFCKINFDSARQFLNYGSRYTVSTFIEVITYSTDYIIVGRYFKESILGIYNRASLLVQLPSQYISANLIKVLFPTLNEIKSDNDRFIKYYQSINYLLGFVLFGVCIFISVNAEEIVGVLLGPKWMEAGSVLKIIALAVPFNLLINYNGLVYDVYARLNQKILIKVIHMIVMVSLYLVLKSEGLKGIAYAYLITETCFYFVYNVVSYRMFKLNSTAIIRSNLPFLSFAVVVFAVSLLVNTSVTYFDFTIGMKFFAEVVITPLLLLILFVLYAPRSVKNVITEVLPVSFLNQSRYFNYLMRNKIFRKYWNANWQISLNK